MWGFIFAFQLLGLLQLGKSQTSCTSDIAIPIDDTSDSGSGSPSDGDAAAAAASIEAAAASNAASLIGRSWEGRFGGSADLIHAGSNPLRRLLRKRAALECTSSETCYSLQGDVLCVDDQTDDFHLPDGTTGNLDTGDYTLPDGEEGNLITGPYPTLSAGASTTFDASAASATGTDDTFTITDASESFYPSATAAGATSASARDTATESAGSSFAVETGTSPSLTRTFAADSSATGADSTFAAETVTPSSVRTTRTSSSATKSPSGSVRVIGAAAAPPARFSASHLVLVVVMGLRAVF